MVDGSIMNHLYVDIVLYYIKNYVYNIIKVIAYT